MGNSCQRCSTEPTIINLSENVINRISAPHLERKRTKEEFEIVNVDDEELFKKIKCIDNVHSRVYGLSRSDIEAMMINIHSRIKILKKMCPTENILECYKQHSNCTLRCQENAETFEECVDFMRVTKLKEFLRRETEKSTTAEKRGYFLKK